MYIGRPGRVIATERYCFMCVPCSRLTRRKTCCITLLPGARSTEDESKRVERALGAPTHLLQGYTFTNPMYRPTHGVAVSRALSLHLTCLLYVRLRAVRAEPRSESHSWAQSIAQRVILTSWETQDNLSESTWTLRVIIGVAQRGDLCQGVSCVEPLARAIYDLGACGTLSQVR